MKNARAVVGNSSLGVREAPFLGVPSLDVGTRQSNRARANSLRHCDARDREAVAGFLAAEWGRRYPSHTGFGLGSASAAFAALLRDPAFWSRPLQKYFDDGPDPAPAIGATGRTALVGG